MMGRCNAYLNNIKTNYENRRNKECDKLQINKLIVIRKKCIHNCYLIK